MDLFSPEASRACSPLISSDEDEDNISSVQDNEDLFQSDMDIFSAGSDIGEDDYYDPEGLDDIEYPPLDLAARRAVEGELDTRDQATWNDASGRVPADFLEDLDGDRDTARNDADETMVGICLICIV